MAGRVRNLEIGGSTPPVPANYSPILKKQWKQQQKEK